MNKELSLKAIEQLSDDDLIFKISDIWLDNYSIYKQELLKRLSNNKVEEYKKKLVDEIEIYIEAEQRDHFYWKEILEFINNLK